MGRGQKAVLPQGFRFLGFWVVRDSLIAINGGMVTDWREYFEQFDRELASQIGYKTSAEIREWSQKLRELAWKRDLDCMRDPKNVKYEYRG